MSANAESPRPLPWGVVLVALLLGAAWRLAALRAEFWLDEILSWDLARQAGWPGGVFVLRHDNNHVLNTLWLTLWPDNAPTWLYRWHTLTAGLATIVVAAIVASRWGRATSGFAALLVAGNPWLVLVSAEARGYSLAVLASLAAFFFLRNYLDRRDLRSLLLFWLASCLGFLGHLTFIYPYLGFLVWSLRRFARAEPGRELAQLVRCHLGVGLFCVGFYLVTLRGMHIEGAPAGPVLPVVARLLVLGLGGPDGSVWGLPYLAIAAGVVITGSWLLWARGDDAWIFFTVTVVAAPTLYLLRQPPFLFEPLPATVVRLPPTPGGCRSGRPVATGQDGAGG
ncbi:MAG: hypothetical protein U0840_01755 [Gemmataceae bacterium]